MTHPLLTSGVTPFESTSALKFDPDTVVSLFQEASVDINALHLTPTVVVMVVDVVVAVLVLAITVIIALHSLLLVVLLLKLFQSFCPLLLLFSLQMREP